MNLISFFRRYILKNWPVKLICLLLALSFWFWVAVQDRDTRSFRAQVEFVDLPEGYTVSDRTSRTVTISVRGPETVLEQFDDDDFKVVSTLEEFDGEETEGEVRVYPWDVQHPRGLEVTSVDPGDLQVFLEPKISRELMLEVEPEARPSDGFELHKNVTPETALVAGPQEKVTEMESLQLEQISWPTPDEAVKVEQIEARLEPSVELKYPETGFFEVELRVEEPLESRTFEGIPVEVIEIPEGMEATVEPDQISFQVKGDAGLIEELSLEDIEVIVTSPTEPGMSIENALVELPEGVEAAPEYELQKSVKVELIEE